MTFEQAADYAFETEPSALSGCWPDCPCYGSFAYTPMDFDNALQAPAQKHIALEDAWTQIEALENGTTCYEKLLRRAPISKFWLYAQGVTPMKSTAVAADQIISVDGMPSGSF